MKKIKPFLINSENFSEFGTLLNPMECGEPMNPGSLYPYYNDRLPLSFSCGSLVTLSVLVLKKRPLKIDVTERHNYTEEIIGGFNSDVIFHAGANRDVPVNNEFKAFILPKNWWVRFKKGAFHHAPFVFKDEEATGFVILPPFTAFNDTIVFELSEEIELII